MPAPCVNASRSARLAAVAAAALAALAAVDAARADILANWTFEVSAPPTVQSPVAGPFAPEAGVRAASSLATSSHRDILTTNSGPTGNGSARSLQCNWWLANDTFLFYTDTTGYDTLTFSFDQTRSSTGPSSFRLGASLDGVNWTDFASYTVPVVAWSATTPQAASSFGPFPVVPLANDQAFVAFRLIAVAAGSTTAGTSRIDNIVITGSVIPAPGGAMVVLGLTFRFAAVRRRRA